MLDQGLQTVSTLPGGVKAQAGETSAGRPRPTLFWNDIRARAREKWQAAGRPPGDSTRFWLEAEQELLEGR